LIFVAVLLIAVVPVNAAAPMRQAGIAPRTTASVKFYLVAIGDNGRFGKKVGCGDSLVAVTRPIAPTEAPLSAALWLLLSDHHRFYGQSGLYNALYQSRLAIGRIGIKNGRAIIHLTGRLRLGGVCDDPRVAGQLKRTAFQFSTVHSVAIFINSVPLKRLLSEK
jgi:hypothetical protein